MENAIGLRKVGQWRFCSFGIGGDRGLINTDFSVLTPQKGLAFFETSWLHESRLGKDPEVVTLTGNLRGAKFTIAPNESYRDQSGQLHTHTDWHPVVAWRDLAELDQKYLRKGSHLYLEGKLKNRSCEDKEGRKHNVSEIVADRFFLLDKPSPA